MIFTQHTDSEISRSPLMGFSCFIQKEHSTLLLSATTGVQPLYPDAHLSATPAASILLSSPSLIQFYLGPSFTRPLLTRPFFHSAPFKSALFYSAQFSFPHFLFPPATHPHPRENRFRQIRISVHPGPVGMSGRLKAVK